MGIFQIWVIQSLSSFLFSFLLLLHDTSHAQLEDYFSNPDSSLVVSLPQDETNSENSFLNDSPSPKVPVSDLFTADDLAEKRARQCVGYAAIQRLHRHALVGGAHSKCSLP